MRTDAELHKGHRERVKQRFLKDGLAHFERHQILEMLLFFGIPRKDTNELAHRLLQEFRSLSHVLNASYPDLMRVPGMTANAAVLIRFCGALSLECSKEQSKKHAQLSSTEEIGDHLRTHFLGQTREMVWMLCLNNRFEVLDSALVTEGNVNATEVNLRILVQRALQFNATMVVIAHNHPSGFALPSREDCDTTLTVKRALDMVNVVLYDHLIFSADDFSSMRDTPSLAPLFIRDADAKRFASPSAT